MSPSRDSAPARSKTVCMNLFGSWTFQTMNPEATTAFLPSVRNSRGGGTRTNRRRSNRLTVWTGAGSLNLSPGELSTRTGLPNWVTTAYTPAPIEHDLDVRYPGKHPLQVFEEGRPIPGDDYNEARHGPSPSGRCTGGGHGALSWHARTDSTAAFRRTSASLIPRIDVG